ncbi:glycosyltransferase [Enterococcus gilvus]|uniref:glycosyltransferase n=1 Tax=Enterococcus gilvus TaxID=160453 RepID=UPI00345E2010
MIFVTVGTHEQQFNRLIRSIDELSLNEKVVIQTGYSNYIPQNVEWKKFYDYDEMNELISKSDICITHGGPATFMNVLEKGKIPIVVPRQKKYGEHVNNHQLSFAKRIVLQGYKLLVVEDTKKLKYYIETARADDAKPTFSNNEKFNELLINEIRKMVN